jgi:hypothetical protein
VHHDVTVEAPFATGGAPNATTTIQSSQLTTPLAASAGDLSKLSSVTVQSVHLQATDGGDLSFVSSATLILSANELPAIQLATLPAAPGAGQGDVALKVDGRDLRAYLAAGAVIAADIEYSARPIAVRQMKLVMVVRGSL